MPCCSPGRQALTLPPLLSGLDAAAPECGARQAHDRAREALGETGLRESDGRSMLEPRGDTRQSVCSPPCAGCASGHHLPLLCESARRCAKAGAAGGAAGVLSPSLGWVFGAQQCQLCDTVCRPQLLTSCMPWRAVKRPRLLEQDTTAEPRLSRAILQQSQTPRSRCDHPLWCCAMVRVPGPQ